MLINNIQTNIIQFLQDNFKGIFNAWGATGASDETVLNWCQIEFWMIFFVIFSFVIIFLLCKSQIIEKLAKHILSLSLTIWFLGVLVYIVGFYDSNANGLSVVLRAIISSFRMFVVSNDLARVNPFLHDNPSYMSLFSILHFAAAVITFLFIFKMIGYKIKSSLKIIIHKHFHAKGKAVHLFWGVNEASLLLAEDIRKKHPNETIIFVDIDKECEDDIERKSSLSNITNSITIKSSEIARLDAIDALVDQCYNGPYSLKGNSATDIFGSLQLKNIGTILQKSSKSYFYFLSDDETKNIAGALNLQKDKKLGTKGKEKPIIYIHARRDANNEIFDHYSQYDGESQRMKIKVVDSSFLSITTLKQDRSALPVNCVKTDKTTGLVESPFTALIVGFGSTGQEAFNFLYEFSAFVGTDYKKSPFKCYAIDEKMSKIAGFVREMMPAIGEEELSLIQADIDSEKFWSTIKGIIGELNYVVIALNNDETGLSFAVNLFKYALKNRPANQPTLKIMLRCYDNSNERRMSEVANNLNKSIEGYNIELRLYGKQKDLYCCDAILSDTILTEAKEFNRVYEDSQLSAEEQWQKNFGESEIVRLMEKKNMSRYHAIYDINRRIAQNISNSMHYSTKMILMGFGDNNSSKRLKLYCEYVNSREYGSTKYKCSEKDAQLLLNIAMVEHERWIAAHKLMGYTYDNENDCVKKLHKYICSWSFLDELTQSYDCNVVDTTIKLAYNKSAKFDGK